MTFEAYILKEKYKKIQGLSDRLELMKQQIEKQKLTIIRKLKRKFEEIEKEYSFKTEKEVLVLKKKDFEK